MISSLFSVMSVNAKEKKRKKEIPLVELQTPRLKIVPLSKEAFSKKLNSDFDGEEFHEAMCELQERAAADKPCRFAWYTNRLIFRLEDGAYIGSVAFMNSPEKDPDKVGLIEIGYSVKEEYRSQGYMTEAVNAMCDWALAQPKVYGMIAGVKDDNPASIRVLEKCGFVMTDHSDALSLQVWKKIPEGKQPLRFFRRHFG